MKKFTRIISALTIFAFSVVFATGMALPPNDVLADFEYEIQEIQAAEDSSNILEEPSTVENTVQNENIAHKISGIVFNEEGTPISGINIKLSGGAIFKEITTNTAGEYLFEGIPSGEYSLYIMQGKHSGVFCYGASERISIIGKDISLNLETRIAKRAIIGTVKNSAGQMLDNVPFTILKTDDPPQYYKGITSYGDFELFSFKNFIDIENGEYIVSIADGKYFGKNYLGEQAKITIADNCAPIDIVLKQVQNLQNYSIFGVLTDEESKAPIAGADIKLYDGALQKSVAKTNSSGKFVFKNLRGNDFYTVIAFENNISNKYFYHEKQSQVLLDNSNQKTNISAKKINPVQIIAQPLSQKSSTNNSATFKVKIENEETDVSYRWQVDKGRGFADIPKATEGSLYGSEYRIRHVKPYMHGFKYRAIINTQWGDIKSKAAVLRIVN